MSKKNKQNNGQKIPKGGNQNSYVEEEQTKQWSKEEKKEKRKNNDLQNIHIKLMIE